MTRLEKRTRLIMRRLTEYLLVDLRVAVVTPSVAAWQSYNLNGPYRFGWMPPIPAEPDQPLLLIVSICPPLIAETTLWLDADDLGMYLDAIEGFLKEMVNQPENPSDVLHAAQERLAEQSPAAMKLVSRVELQAIDDGIVTAGATGPAA